MSEILTTIQNATPALAAVIIGILFSMRAHGKEIEALKKRVEKYDDMNLGIKLAEIQKDIAYIREKLEEGE